MRFEQQKKKVEKRLYYIIARFIGEISLIVTSGINLSCLHCVFIDIFES